MSNPVLGPRKALTYGTAAAAVQVALAVLTNLKKLTAGAPGSPARFEDTDIYFRYASMMLAGKVPYRDFPVEYPPLALPLFLAPGAVARGVAGFKIAFAAEMLLFNAATVLLAAWWLGRGWDVRRVRAGLVWYTVYVALLSRLIVSRYDAAPMFLGFAASVLWFSGRGASGGLAACLGAATKVFPALVAAVGVCRDAAGPGPWTLRSRWRGAAAFGAGLAVVAAAWLGVGGVRGVGGFFAYHLERGLEYGSVYSGAQMLAAKIVGEEITIVRGHASYASVTPWSARLAGLVLPIQVSALLTVCGTFLWREAREPLRYSAAAVLAFIVTGKVFSPQYLIWLLPYVVVLEGPVAAHARRIYAAGCVSTLLAAAGLPNITRTSLSVILAYDTRNLILLWLLAVLVFGPASASSPGPDDGADGRQAG